MENRFRISFLVIFVTTPNCEPAHELASLVRYGRHGRTADLFRLRLAEQFSLLTGRTSARLWSARRRKLTSLSIRTSVTSRIPNCIFATATKIARPESCCAREHLRAARLVAEPEIASQRRNPRQVRDLPHVTDESRRRDFPRREQFAGAVAFWPSQLESSAYFGCRLVAVVASSRSW